MNPLLAQIVSKTILRQKKKTLVPERQFTRFELANGLRELKLVTSYFIQDVFLIALGIISAAFGLESFLIPSHFIDGGATGVALLISVLNDTPLSIVLIAVNIPFIILGYRILGSQFALRAAFAIAGLAIVIAVTHFPEVTHDKLLVAVFGGFFLGLGIGFAVRGGAVLDGTEILAISLSKKLGTTFGDVIIMVNIIVFLAAAYFLSVETALYSMVTYLSASKTLDIVLEGIEENTGVTIVSAHSEEIRTIIIKKLGRGVTMYKGKRGYGERRELDDVDIIYTVITRLEINKLTLEIEKIDPLAFVVMNSIKDTKGGMIKRRRHKH
jgi:uncharacterized membrane-anchored protein YitT (DUF2179 family)